MSDKVRIKLYCHTGYGTKYEDIVEVNKEYWDDLDEEDKEEWLQELATDFMGNCIDFGAYVMEGDEE